MAIASFDLFVDIWLSPPGFQQLSNFQVLPWGAPKHPVWFFLCWKMLTWRRAKTLMEPTTLNWSWKDWMMQDTRPNATSWSAQTSVYRSEGWGSTSLAFIGRNNPKWRSTWLTRIWSFSEALLFIRTFRFNLIRVVCWLLAVIDIEFISSSRFKFQVSIF